MFSNVNHSKRVRFVLFILISVISFIIIYWLWPKYDRLPVLDTVQPFQMESVHDDKYDLNNDKVKLISFFYTNCPDVCPLTMVDFKELQFNFKKEEIFGKDVELVAITLDPEHDSKQVLTEYAKSFEADPKGWKWLRGTKAETKQIANRFQMQYQRLDDNFFSHSITMYLVDSKNQIRAIYDMANTKKPIDKESIMKDIDYLVKSE
ncbi:SCO family protein [Metabacillus malikii]|uniref:Protein SCO1/2 n=1 Tax=Metabacillus malikii TaxID=1504265 RepID=A0ABT9ZDV5_9BACI|nr:SCO family protein [Metabacillus malikii]MDQ0230438.1 protein SCO1/2 [Metabacillus malikii]